MKRIIHISLLLLLVAGSVQVVQAQGVITLPRTGQTTCYSASGISIICGGTGQDGEFQEGAAWPSPRFSTITGCFTDDLTGLMWVTESLFATLPSLQWADAVAYANDNSFCGFSDWRLPNINERQSLTNSSVDCTSDALPGYPPYNQWSSTTVVNLTTYALGGNTCHWPVAWQMKTTYLTAWPVRIGQASTPDAGYPANVPKTGQTTSFETGDDGDLEWGVAWPSPRFTANANQTVTDNLTGLVWTQDMDTPGPATCSPGVRKQWQDSLDHVQCLNDNNYLGYSDWRLPNRVEQRSLIDYGEYNPALPAGHPFTNVQSAGFWTSTTVLSYSNKGAWVINTYGGTEIEGGKDTVQINWVWPVGGAGAVGPTCVDQDGDGYGDPGDSSCPSGGETDCDDGDDTVYPGATEVCDGKDNDCDGSIDEDPVDPETWYRDADSDSYGDSTNTTTACTQPAGYVADSTDCDDTRAAVNPGATEIHCDGLDNDCSGATVDAPDADSDGYDVCNPGDPNDPDGLDEDCDDGNAAINPGEDEICGDGIDNDCDGNTDDVGIGAPVWYQDSDSDGYGNPAVSQTACSQPAGYVSDNTDCDDTLTAVNPGALEVCGDGIDNDCNGITDDDGIGSTTWYVDADNDGYGDATVSQTACSQPAGYVADGTDCDDGNELINPGAAEICGDGVDNNCDGFTDDTGIGAATWYLDADSDGYGDAGVFSTVCSQPAGYVLDNTDCDDTNSDVHPGAAELCADGIDNDCDPLTADIFDGDGDTVDCDVDCDDADPGIGLCNTPESPDDPVVVEGDDVTVTYPNVTTPGDTQITREPCNFTEPDGFVTPPQPECVTVDTTAGFDGEVEICVTYNAPGTSCTFVQNLDMLRFDRQCSVSGNECSVDDDCSAGETCNSVYVPLQVTSRTYDCFDGTTDLYTICALTEHFSQFVLGEMLDSDNDTIEDLFDNCPLTINWFQLDADMDGHGDGCDCGSSDPYSYPGGQEFCDGLDNNCDTVTDESCLAACETPTASVAPFALTDSALNAGNPSLIWNGTEYGVAWNDFQDGNWEIYFARLDASGVPIGLQLRVTDDGALSVGPSLVWTGSEYAVTWRDERHGNSEIYFARIDASGNKIGSDVRVTENAGNSHTPSLVWTGLEYGVAWHDDRDQDGDPNTEIYFARLHLSGDKLGADQRITNALGDSGRPSLVWTGEEYGVSWHDYEFGEAEILMTRIDSLGNPIGSPVRVTNATGDSGMSSLVWTGTTFGVTWHDYRDMDWEIYFARLLSDGTKIGSDLRVTNAADTSGYPNLVWSGRDFGIFWHDLRGGTWEVYQAVVNPAGVKVGGDAVMTTDPAGSYAVSAAWTGTEYGLAWHDDREGNYEVYFTRADCCADFDLDGVDTCSFDCNDNDPDTFPDAPEVNDGVDNQCPGDPGYGVIDETSGNSGFNTPGDTTEYSWPAQTGATLYEVARAGSADFSVNCSTRETVDTFWIDLEEPTLGNGFYYLNRSVAPFIGSWGQDSAGLERIGICP